MVKGLYLVVIDICIKNSLNRKIPKFLSYFYTIHIHTVCFRDVEELEIWLNYVKDLIEIFNRFLNQSCLIITLSDCCSQNM